jgi:hypothetical protein
VQAALNFQAVLKIQAVPKFRRRASMLICSSESIDRSLD